MPCTSAPGRLFSKRDGLILGLLVLLWIAMVPLIDPRGEFPTNDDWDYAKSVRSIVEDGRFTLSPEARVTLVAQAYWGALFTVPVGFSFLALRLSTLVLGLLGIAATFGLLRESGASISLAALGALCLALNPMYVQLSDSFMTDVPFAALSFAALLAFAIAIRTRGAVPLAIGVLFAVLASLIRPLALVLPLGFAAGELRWSGIGRAVVVRIAIAFAGPPLALAAWQQWAMQAGLLGFGNNPQAHELEAALAKGAVLAMVATLAQTGTALVYIGLYLLPLLLPLAAFWFGSGRGALARWVLVLAASGGITGALLATGNRMPLSENLLIDIGLGPLTLRDTFFLTPDHWPSAPSVLWDLVTLVGVFGGILLALSVGRGVWQVFRRASKPGPAAISAMCLTVTAVYFLPLAMTGYLDRYFVFIFTPLMAAAVASTGVWRAIPVWAASAAGVGLGALGLFSVVATHDYFVWQRTRWTALHYLMDELHIPPSQIDGGFEFNGWYTYRPNYQRTNGISWWWVQHDDYLVTFGDVPGFEPIRRYAFPRLLPPGSGEIVILRKNGQ